MEQIKQNKTVGNSAKVSTKNNAIYSSGDPLITMNRFPFIGPRFLNFVSAVNSNKRIKHARMISYYEFIKGSNIKLFGLDRPVSFASDLDINFHFSLRDEVDVGYLELEYKRFSFIQIGYIEHLPCKNWCINPYENTFFVRNELDCVGFSGIDRFENGFEQDLVGGSIRALNILPSLHVDVICCEAEDVQANVYRVESENNFIRMNHGSVQLFVQISDYDAYKLATCTRYFNGLDYFIGKKGLVYDSLICPPNLQEMDGYRFWYWMYNIDYPTYGFSDYFFSGSALRRERFENWINSIWDDEVYSLKRLFKEKRSKITLQGAAFSSMQDMYTSVNEIGKFAKTANCTKTAIDGYIEQPWVQSLIGYITSVAQNVADLAREFYAFKEDPVAYIKQLSTQMRLNFVFPETLTLTNLQSGIVLSIAAYLYDKSQIISLGLFLYGYYNFYKQCYADRKYAEVAAVVTTLISVGVLKAIQLRPVSITLQSTNNLSSMIFAACSFVTLGFASKGITATNDSVIKHLFANTKDIFAISRGALSLSKCVEYVVDTLKMACEYVFGNTFAYETLVKMTVTSKDLQEYIQYCLITQPEDLATKLTLDFEYRRQWDRICMLHKDLIKLFSTGTPPTETHIGYNMYVRACANFAKLRAEYEKIKHSLDHFRAEPFMVWIWGAPGTGKTWCRDLFVNNMYRWHSTIEPSLPDVRKTGLLYVRNPADKYMSRYNGEFALAYDDVGQNRQTDNPEFNEIMGFGSTNQVKLNMADLEDKGRLFSSRVVIMAANSKNVVANNLILKEDAFNRRRHIVIEIRRPQSSSTDLSTSRCDFTKVQLVLSDPISGEDIISFPANGFGDDAVEFKNMFEWIAPRYAKHVQDQNTALESKQKALFSVLNGDADPTIVDLPEKMRVLAEEDLKNKGKFSKIVYYQERDEELQDIIQGIKNCYSEGMERPTTLLTNEFNSFCERNDIEQFDDDEWEFFKEKNDDMTPENVESIEELWNQRTQVLESKFPWTRILKGAGFVLSGLALYKMCSYFINKTEDVFDIQGYNTEVKAAPNKGKVHVQGYSVEVKAAPSNKVVIQGTELEDFVEPVNALTSVVGNLSRSVARFTKQNSSGNFYAINGFNVCYNAWLIPRHFFGHTITDCTVRIERENLRPEIINIEKKNVYTLCIEEGKERDVCLVYIPSLPHGKNHMKHFATRKQLATVKNFTGKMLRWNSSNSRVEEACLGFVERWDQPLKIDADGNEIYFSSGYKYNFNTAMGDCGGVLISMDYTTQARIFGIHFGFNNTEKKGMSQHLSREDIEVLVRTAVPKVDLIDAQNPKVEIQAADCPKELFDSNGVPYFEHFGYVRDGPLPPKDHGDLHRSPLYGEVYPPEKDLAVLSKYDNRLLPEHRGDPDILVRGVIDFAYESKPWPEAELSIAQRALTSELEKFKTPIDKRILTLDEAINGVWVEGARLEYCDDINLKTAAGYGLPGVKRDHFITEEIRCPFTEKLEKIEHRIINPKLQQQVDDMWSDWLDGKTHSIPWSHTLKIEALKLSKIPNGNTRTFCVASTALLLNVRRLFGSFTTAMKKSKIESFSCLGVDANSRDWNDLYVNLRNTGPNGADMDFFKFDRTAVTWQLARKVCEAINEWYNDDIVYQRARIIAFEEMIFAYGLINKHLTRKIRGNPSGNPLTTELNNCVNYLMLCMVYLIIAKKRSPEDYSILKWQKNVNMKAYGDDIIFTLNPKCAEWFDFKLLEETYKEFGVPVTPADKSDAGVVLHPLEELTFLKRNFRPFDHHDVKWQSALSQTSIKSMIQFYRLKPNNGTMFDAIRTNCLESLIESYHWGEDFFTEHLNKINKWMIENSYPTIPITYVELDTTYRSKLETGY